MVAVIAMEHRSVLEHHFSHAVKTAFTMTGAKEISEPEPPDCITEDVLMDITGVDAAFATDRQLVNKLPQELAIRT